MNKIEARKLEDETYNLYKDDTYKYFTKYYSEFICMFDSTIKTSAINQISGCVIMFKNNIPIINGTSYVRVHRDDVIKLVGFLGFDYRFDDNLDMLKIFW